ncbi:SDR family NAD(P)-dependent oxidoreductase [Verrucomicrobium spinosum]|uniref:SDR family NAD(P)-dependent oxidoreductase n=1 Tax=Verrucomicrobium spinosum TaxID=2736 RepID=UPI0001744D8D|nr:SDR family oxidoreductase [Verrucomicrobium spinosum]
MNLQIENQLALVSASTKGIGLAIARALAREGARVIINGRSAASVDEAVARILEAVPNAQLEKFPGDLSDAATAENLAAAHPEVDILVNNLGIFDPKPFSEIPDAEWLRFFDVNVLSGVRLSRLYFDGMIKRNRGRIIFISSESALHIPSEMIHYGMTKTAQLAVARGLAELSAGTAVTVNSVLPGPTRSEGVEEFVDKLSGGQPFETFEQEFFEKVRPTSLLKRFETVDEIANVVAFVCSPLASGINGSSVRVEGGLVKAIA